MVDHISARLAWHMNGWNGHICDNPAANTYCTGQHSYPGQMIAERRELEWEQANKGRCCSQLDKIPPCIYSINAFGSKELTAFSDPPKFFKDTTERLEWQLPPATISVWPYEEMYYAEGVEKASGGFDYDKRLEASRNYFDAIEVNRSLIFYYANYSNPFSEEEQQCYVLVGVSRIKQIGEELFYNNCSEETKRKYVGFVWQRNITSHYPEQGFCIPYHLYMGQPEILKKLLFIPDNPQNFKYATRKLSDDDALDLLERFLEITTTLKEIGDTSNNWEVRISWLQSLIAELWQNRGLYPGLAKILDYLQLKQAIPFFKQQVNSGKEQSAKNAIFAYLNNQTKTIAGLDLSQDVAKENQRQWQLKEDSDQKILEDILPRFDLTLEQIERILSSKRSENGIYATIRDIIENPYIICESYIGNDQNDIIQFSKIDHGIFPSPELGGEFLIYKLDNPRRLRALCVERLKKESKHTFLSAKQVISDVNQRLSFLSEWKRSQFTERYLEVDEQELSGALTFRKENGQNYIYLKDIYESERAVEKQIRFLAKGGDIRFKSPVTEKYWENCIYNLDSILVTKNPEEYKKAIQGQIDVCKNIFIKPVCVISGGAGTGKTTIIKALIQAVEKAHGSGTSFKLLAPTGKAADRIRGATNKAAETIHSFLAKHGWLNDNFTFKRSGGEKVDNISTYIIDEASMLDLNLAAALFRAINWTSVQRLILVGDPNQLPPIGRGRIFADIIDWFTQKQPENLGVLKTNIRQMENRLTDKGTGILELAELYTHTAQTDQTDEVSKIKAEDIFRRIQEGDDVDKDLRVIYWNNPDELADKLKATIVKDMEEDTGKKFNPDKPYELWRAAFSGNNEQQRPEYQQVISPYRGELFGVDHLNTTLQLHNKGKRIDFHRTVGKITLFDKVIQYRNRSKSNPIWAYNTSSRKSEKIEIFNGELGFVKPHAFDCKKDEKTKKQKWTLSYYPIKHFQVVFCNKEKYWVPYSSENEVEDNLELAYAISVHKSQGSEFERVYFVIPKNKTALLSPELFYTGLTRAKRHCTLLIEEDISTLISLHRPEKSCLAQISSSLFFFQPIKEEMQQIKDWYEEGKIHRTLADFMVRSKSEVIIANILFERDIPFKYEVPLFAEDGTFYRPDFTIKWRGEDWYWEHLGLLSEEKYRLHWSKKKEWYEKFFPERLVTTEESGNLSQDANAIIHKFFS